ncbi:AfsR/SARP family transcriptional regulator [Streptomyces sp. NPDC006367]|uniref:AfsR/SARP family transcriptional regulator n=1 Tax=unclassified Streptomyces TaxID=2593676 RepID=UPI0033B3B27B
MRIRVLGSFEAELNGSSVLPTAGKPRQILALLVLHSEQVLPVSALMEEIWMAEPPRSALTTLQTYILQIRRCIDAALGPGSPVGAKDLLLTRHGGYLLRVDPGSVDLHEYERLRAQGRQAMEEGDDALAARSFRAALGLWRGPALSDVRCGPLLSVETMHMEESRLGLLEQCIDAELRLGRHAELLAELSTLTAHHPLHEGLHALSMVAYYRAGRPSSALDVYRRLRTNLIGELGIEPSPRLRRLHQAVLGGDPVLQGTSAVPVPQPAPAGR